ncbi:hypothetical protein [Selenihalanaerobacter shriftii]|nr:hypothetical protein [Selenihalanaerobacter shriftii]
MDEIIEEEYDLIDSDEKMINLIEGESISSAEKELITWVSSFKGSG